jgi:hypothetical protein
MFAEFAKDTSYEAMDLNSVEIKSRQHEASFQKHIFWQPYEVVCLLLTATEQHTKMIGSRDHLAMQPLHSYADSI